MGEGSAQVALAGGPVAGCPPARQLSLGLCLVFLEVPHPGAGLRRTAGTAAPQHTGHQHLNRLEAAEGRLCASPSSTGSPSPQPTGAEAVSDEVTGTTALAFSTQRRARALLPHLTALSRHAQQSPPARCHGRTPSRRTFTELERDSPLRVRGEGSPPPGPALPAMGTRAEARAGLQ